MSFIFIIIALSVALIYFLVDYIKGRNLFDLMFTIGCVLGILYQIPNFITGNFKIALFILIIIFAVIGLILFYRKRRENNGN